MKQISTQLQIPKQQIKVKSERDELIRMFAERINQDREGTKWKPVSLRGIAMKVTHVETSDLYAFYKMCHNARNFGEMFFGRLKVKK